MQRIVKLVTLISLVPIVCLGDVNLCNLPNSWKLSAPPDAFTSTVKAAGMNCELYYVDSLTSAVIAQLFRPRSGPMTISEYHGSVAGLQEGYAKGMSKNGTSALMNDMIKSKSAELLHQEYRRNGIAYITITQVAANGLYQVLAVVPEEMYDDSLQLALNSFTSVAPPLSSVSASQFDEGYKSGKALGEALALGLILVIIGGGIGFAVRQFRRRHDAAPK